MGVEDSLDRCLISDNIFTVNGVCFNTISLWDDLANTCFFARNVVEKPADLVKLIAIGELAKEVVYQGCSLAVVEHCLAHALPEHNESSALQANTTEASCLVARLMWHVEVVEHVCNPVQV